MDKDPEKMNEVVKSLSGLPVTRALSLFLFLVLILFSVSVIIIVNLNVNRFFADGLDGFLMRDMLAIRNTTDSFLDNRIKVLHDHARFSEIMQAVEQPDDRNPMLGEFMANLKLLGHKQQLSLLSRSGRLIHTTMPYPLFNYEEAVWLRKLRDGAYQQYTGISRFSDRYFWQLAVPVAAHQQISGFLVAEIPVEDLDADREFSLILSGSQVQYLLEDKVIASFGTEIDSRWEEFNMPSVGATMRYRVDKSAITALYKSFLVKLTLFLVGLSSIIIAAAIVMSKRFFALPLNQSRIITAALAQGATAVKVSTNDRIREIGLLKHAINIMADKIIKRENSLREDRNYLETRVHERTKELKQEIAERQKIEHALRKSERQLQLALEGANLGLWDWNIKTNEFYINQRWAEMLGYNSEKLEPHIDSWKNLIHPSDKDEVMNVFNAHIEGKISFYVSEHRLKTKDGQWNWVLSRGKVVEKDKDGFPARVTGTHLDISNRKRTDEEMIRIRKAVACASDAISITSAEGGYFYCNEAFTNLFGYTLADLAQPEAILPLFANIDEGLLIFKATQKGEPWKGEVEIRSKSGTIIPAFIQVNLIRDEMEENIGLVWTYRDITERKKMLAELKRARQAAKAANQAKNDFLTRMSYELLTPLRAILAYARQLKETPNMPESGLDAAEAVFMSGNYLQVMINDILDLSHIDADKIELEPIALDILEFLNGVVEYAAKRAEAKGLTFNSVVSANLPAIVHADRKCLRQIMINLINHAIHRAATGGIRFSVTALTDDQATIRFYIEVIGKASGEAEAANGPLSAPDSGREEMALSYGWKLIRLMGGELHIESAPGQGAVFWFQIPFNANAKARFNP